MIVYHSKKKVFWRNPKTGSTSMEALLRRCVPPTSKDVATRLPYVDMGSINFDHGRVSLGHLTPYSKYDPLTDEQHEEYDHYCFIRDPIDRFVSSYRHIKGSEIARGIDPEDFHQFAKNKCDGNRDYDFEFLLRPQYKYFDEVDMNPLFFDHWEEEMNKVIKMLGGKQMVATEYPQYRKNNLPTIKRHEMFKETIDIITESYKRDIQLYERLTATPYKSL